MYSPLRKGRRARAGGGTNRAGGGGKGASGKGAGGKGAGGKGAGGKGASAGAGTGGKANGSKAWVGVWGSWLGFCFGVCNRRYKWTGLVDPEPRIYLLNG